MRPSGQNRRGVVRAEALKSLKAGLPNESNIIQDTNMSSSKFGFSETLEVCAKKQWG
jgi:hypothetical protein